MHKTESSRVWIRLNVGYGGIEWCGSRHSLEFDLFGKVLRDFVIARVSRWDWHDGVCMLGLSVGCFVWTGGLVGNLWGCVLRLGIIVACDVMCCYVLWRYLLPYYGKKMDANHL